MVDEVDAGPVYLKRPLSLEGRAEEIYERTADLVYDMISEIIADEPVPVPQSGEAVVFSADTRRKRSPASRISGSTLRFHPHARRADLSQGVSGLGRLALSNLTGRSLREIASKPVLHCAKEFIVTDIVLAVVAHPDDEVLGAGGTLARHAASGTRCTSCFSPTASAHAVTTSGCGAPRQAARHAASLLGAKEPISSFPDNRLDQIDLLDIIQAIER